MKLFFSPDDGGAGGGAAGAGGNTSGGSNTAADTSGQKAAAGAGDGKQAQPGSQGQGGAGDQGNREPQFTYKEDRSKWLPPHREGEIRKSVETATEKRVRESMQREIDDRQRRLEVALGVHREPEVDPQVAKARENFFAVFPELKDIIEELGPKDIRSALKELVDNRQNLFEASSFTWNSHGGRALRSLFEKATEALEVDELTKGQKDKLFASFRSQLQDDQEFAARYNMDDPTLIDDFLKSWVEDFVEPVRSRTLSPAVRNARQPIPSNRGGGRQVQTIKRKPIPAGDLDAALDAAVDYMKEQGTEFSE